MIRIFGYSDDNVCLEERSPDGALVFQEEIGCYDSRVTIVVGGEWRCDPGSPAKKRFRGDGIFVTGRHGKRGWTFSVALLGDETGPGIFPTRIERDGYTPVLVIDAPMGVRLWAKKASTPWWGPRKGPPKESTR